MLRAELDAGGREAAGGRPVLPVALSLGGIALVDLLAGWPDAPVEACVTVGSQAPLLYTFDAIPSMPYDEADPPHLPVPWLNIYDTRDFLSFLAEPLFRRVGRAGQRRRPARPLRPRLPGVAQRVLGAAGRLGCDRHGLHVAADRAAHRAPGTAARVRGTGRAGAGWRIGPGSEGDAAAGGDPSGGRGSLSGGSSPLP